jgi:pilus assembly protein Flp/PilA
MATLEQMKRLLKDESGATAIEYGLIAAGISVAIIAVVQGLGTKLTSTFTSVQNALN